MNYIIPFLLSFKFAWLKYALLFPINAVIGPPLSLAVGFLIFQGYFDPILAYVVLIIGDLVLDSVYYYIGRVGYDWKWVQKYLEKDNVLSRNIPALEKIWHTHGQKMVFLSKLAYGLSGGFLISAGFARLPYQKFIMYATPVALIEYIIFLIAGYALGSSFMLAAKYIQYGSIAIAVLLLIFITFYIYSTKYIKGELSKLEQESESA